MNKQNLYYFNTVKSTNKIFIALSLVYLLIKNILDLLNSTNLNIYFY